MCSYVLCFIINTVQIKTFIFLFFCFFFLFFFLNKIIFFKKKKNFFFIHSLIASLLTFTPSCCHKWFLTWNNDNPSLCMCKARTISFLLYLILSKPSPSINFL